MNIDTFKQKLFDKFDGLTMYVNNIYTEEKRIMDEATKTVDQFRLEVDDKKRQLQTLIQTVE